MTDRMEQAGAAFVVEVQGIAAEVGITLDEATIIGLWAQCLKERRPFGKALRELLEARLRDTPPSS